MRIRKILPAILCLVGPKQVKYFLTSPGDKAPKVECGATGTGEFNGEALTEQPKMATLLITAICE